MSSRLCSREKVMKSISKMKGGGKMQLKSEKHEEKKTVKTSVRLSLRVNIKKIKFLATTVMRGFVCD